MNKITLQAILDILNNHSLVKESKINDRLIEYISYNSKDINKNTLFFCKGAKFNSDYLSMALLSGAVAYIAESKINEKSDYIIVSDVRKAMAYVADAFYDKAYDKLNLIGITGTKGKSTTAYYTKYILDEYCSSIDLPETGIISSIDTYDGVEKKESLLTTPEALNLHKHFSNAVKTGIKYMTMEVSSQALKYDRVLGVHYNVGAYLNFSEDHISSIEHNDIEDYFNSKMKLFSLCDTACINLDDETSQKALEHSNVCKKIVTFSEKNKSADVYGFDIKKDNHDIVFKANVFGTIHEYRLTMPGLFNVYNALCAIAICSCFDIPYEYIYKGLVKARASGRMEAYSNSDNSIVAIVDYAHNSLSFETLYKSVMEEYKGRKIITVFGCPGKKAINRRCDLGTLSGKYSDKVIITEEDFGEESLEKICNEIAGFVKAQNCPYEIIGNRGDAIRKAILDCTEKTIILITGKGNETRLKRGSVYEPCQTDVFYAKKYLKEYDIKHKIDKSQMIENIDSILHISCTADSSDEQDITASHLRNLHLLKQIDKDKIVNDIFKALPVLEKKSGTTIVIKYGGSALENPVYIESIIQDIAVLSLCGINVVLVHGGGKTITAMLDKLNIQTEFIGGYRKTTPDIAEVAEMILKGKISSHLVTLLRKYGLSAVALSGKDCELAKAEKKLIGNTDIGLVGNITSVNTNILNVLMGKKIIPVISPLSYSDKYETLNINADDMACEIAIALKAHKLIFLTDENGLLIDNNNPDTVIHSLDISRTQELIDKGFVGGGMIPKLKNCANAVIKGVECVSIIDGRKKHTILLESLSDKDYGTTISDTEKIISNKIKLT